MDAVDKLDDGTWETGDGGGEADLATDDDCADDGYRSSDSTSWCPPEDDVDADSARYARESEIDESEIDDCDDGYAASARYDDADCGSGDSLAALPESNDTCDGAGRVDSSIGDGEGDPGPRAGSTGQPVDVDPESDPSAPLVPLNLSAAAAATAAVTAPGASPFAGVPGLGGDTEAILGSVSGQLADAGLIAHSPLGSTDPALAAAMQRADISGRAAASLAGSLHEETIRNDVREHEQVASTIEDSRREELNAWFAEHLPNSTQGTT